MAHQEIIRASPNEGFSIAHKAMDDTVDFYLKNGGPAVARTNIENLANTLKFYDDCTEAYLHAMERISLAEEAERLQEEARKMQQMQQMLLSVMKTATSSQKGKPTADNGQGKRQEAEPEALPAKLSSEKAMKMWRILMQEGMIDEHYQPVELSRSEVALLAEEMTIRLADENDNLLDIKEWKPYETIWHRKNMKADHQRARILEKATEFRSRLKQLFADI